MKNIKKYIVTLSFVLFGSYSVIYAYGGDMSSNGIKSNNMNMQQLQMHNGMNQQMIKKIRALQDDFMNRLKKEVDPYTAKELDKIIVRHRKDMKEFMAKRAKLSMEEIGILKEKMRQKHFKDLKNVLVEYPAILIKTISGRVMNGGGIISEMFRFLKVY